MNFHHPFFVRLNGDENVTGLISSAILSAVLSICNGISLL